MKNKRIINAGNQFNPLIMLFYGLILTIVGYIIIVGRAAPPAPTIYLNPASQTYAINTTFTVEVRENSGTTAVNAVQANFNYPANLVDIVSIDTTGTAFPTVAQTTGANGSVSIGLGASAGSSGVTGDQLVARVNFKTKTTGGAVAMTFTTGTALVAASSNIDLLGSLSATQGGSYTIDTTAPTASITSPLDGAILAGGSTNIVSVNAADNTSISKVEVYIDGTLKTTDTTSPYSYSWNTTGLTLGLHTVQAKAYDPYGNSSQTATNTVTLTDQTAPSVSLTTPTTGATVNGTISLTASASDNSGGTGVIKVEFYVDGTLKSTDTTSPYAYSWDTKTVLDGSHTLTAKAYDGASPANTKTSMAVNVTVDNADHTPPTTPGSFRTTGQTFTSISLAWNASTDNVGVVGYRVQRNGTTLITTTNLTYTDSNGLTEGTSYSYSVEALDANGNASAPANLTVSTKALKPGDVNNDGKVDIFDLSTLLSEWGSTSAACDLNQNGTVDIFDLSILLSNYGT